jgi:hypothetical protein
MSEGGPMTGYRWHWSRRAAGAGLPIVFAAALLGLGATSALAQPSQTARTAVVASPGAVSSPPAGWSARKLPLPAGFTEDTALPTAQEISCLRSGSCVTAVSFNGINGGELAVGGGKSWRAVRPPVPANDLNGPKANDGAFFAVGCGPARCVAVGSYPGATGTGMLAETGSGSSWTPDELPAPAGWLSTELVHVSCGTVCAAIGTVAIRNKGNFALLELGSGTKWKDSVVAAPAGADQVPELTLTSVACRGGNCVAAGSYLSKTRGTEGLLEVESGGKWKSVAAPLPARAAGTNQDVTLNDIACPTATFCNAVGTYLGTGGTGQAEFITGSGTRWTAEKVPVPKGGGGPDPQFVGCASATACTASGDYIDSDGFEHMMITVRSGKILTSIRAPAPSNGLNVGHGQTILIEGQVACLSARLCVTVGAYNDKPGHEHPAILTGAGTKWTVRELPVPAGSPADPEAALSWLACPRACEAVGIYDGQVPYLSAGPA